MKNPILCGNAEIAYRDPACIYTDGLFRLFFTISRKRGGYMYNSLGYSESVDLENWSEPRQITEDDLQKNYCSPGNILKVGEEYLICVTSYPMPFPYSERSCADDSARLFLIATRDFHEYSKPVLIHAKGDIPVQEMGRMIDPYIFRDRVDASLYHLFFKQNGVSHSVSRDLQHWEYVGRIDGGENSCVVERDGAYHLFHSPKTGIGHKVSRDLKAWVDRGVENLGQSEWDWASGRLTAGFVMERPAEFTGVPENYIVFFHGSRADSVPETHGDASLGIAFTDDFDTFRYTFG